VNSKGISLLPIVQDKPRLAITVYCWVHSLTMHRNTVLVAETRLINVVSRDRLYTFF
jgi:hypothetical protein